MADKIYIVRLWDKISNPMVGEICGVGKKGALCYDKKMERIYYPNDQVLVDKNGNEIIGLNLEFYNAKN